MKLFLFPALLLCTLQGTAQNTDKPLSISAAEKLAGCQATFDEVKATFGKPVRETMSPDNATIEYNADDIVCRFMFDKNHQLTNISYMNKAKQDAALSYEQVKQACKKLNATEIRKRLGTPAEAQISGNEENWYYRAGKGTMLLVKLDISGTAPVVKKYEFYSGNNNTTTAEINAQQAEALQKGISTTKDLLREFGEPAKLRLSDQGEEWLYTSGNTMLMVYFDGQSVMNNYMYRNDSGKGKL